MRTFIAKLSAKVRTFFYGRNGFDDLAKLALIVWVIAFLVYGFCPRGAIKTVLYFVSLAILGYAYFRILSKNIYKRVAENKRYLGAVNMTKTRWNQRKTHKFYRCPKCKTWLRVPRKRGKITITCVKCATKFDKRT